MARRAQEGEPREPTTTEETGRPEGQPVAEPVEEESASGYDNPHDVPDYGQYRGRQ